MTRRERRAATSAGDRQREGTARRRTSGESAMHGARRAGHDSGSRQAQPMRHRAADETLSKKRGSAEAADETLTKKRRDVKTGEPEGAAKRRASHKRSAGTASSGRHAAAGKRAQDGNGISGEARRKDAKKRPQRLANISGDIFLEEWDAPAPKRKKKKSRNKRLTQRQAAANLVLAAGIFAMTVMGGLLVYRHHVFAEMKRVVEAQTFYDGTTVDGIDVSDMTLASATDYWQRQVEPAYAGRTVTLNDSTVLKATELGYQSDYEAVLSNAWSAGRRGSLEQRYRAAVSRAANPMAYSVSRSLYSDAALDGYVQALSDRIDKPARDASIASFDAREYEFVFSDSETGRRLDADGLKRSIAQALNAGGGSAEMVVERLEPEVTTEEVTARYGMIAYAVTNASSSSSNRLKNIELAISLINGVCLKSGETFSFNDTVGERTTDRGFRRATAYSSGTVTEEVGGGICQVSTTLFNAAVKSDLEIIERHNHSLTVGYVDKGKDATVNWKSQDLKFKNTTDDDIYICCFLSSDKRVRFGIFGKLLPNGETITLEGVTRETIKYDTQYQYSAFLAPGETKVVEQGKNGFKAEAYKIRWNADGKQLSKELLCKSYYKSRDEVIQYGR